MEQYILALDQGTTSSRCLVFDSNGSICGTAQQEFEQIYPKPGEVEHDPEEIWATQVNCTHEALSKSGISINDVAAVGITNQRETAIVWDRETGQPVCNAIVWQSRLTTPICDRLKREGLEPLFRERTGLVLDPYFSGTKISWILDQIPGARQRADQGKLAFGTVDSFLIWKLTGGRVHATDFSNASRTLLFNIHTLEWDDELLRILGVPRSMMPEVRESSGSFGETDAGIWGRSIPITGVAGDQQAATFGQCCFEPGMVKNTYGTGCFLLMNTGTTPVASANGLLTTIAWSVGGQVEYCLEGAIFVAGAAVQWLRDELQIIQSAAESESLAASVHDSGGVFFVPAFVGLGAPYWDSAARGALLGLTRGSNRGHIARAALESMAFQTRDVVEAMAGDSSAKLRQLRVDGGATANDLLMQIQADQLQTEVIRPVHQESTARGAAFLAGLAAGIWSSRQELESVWAVDRVFRPQSDAGVNQRHYANWKRAVERTREWINEPAELD